MQWMTCREKNQGRQTCKSEALQLPQDSDLPVRGAHRVNIFGLALLYNAQTVGLLTLFYPLNALRCTRQRDSERDT